MTADTANADGGAPEIEYDRSVIGQREHVGTVQVTREQIAEYCETMGETNPLYIDEDVAAKGPYGAIIAPPAYLLRMRLSLGPDPKVKFGNVTFHAGERLELFEPVRAGDTLTAYAFPKEVYAKTGRSGTMVFVIRRLDYFNQHETLVAALEHSLIHREV